MGLAEQKTLRESIWGTGRGGGGGRERGRKILFVLQTTAGDPCIVSPEMRWEMQKKKTNKKKKTNMLTKILHFWGYVLLNPDRYSPQLYRIILSS